MGMGGYEIMGEMGDRGVYVYEIGYDIAGREDGNLAKAIYGSANSRNVMLNSKLMVSGFPLIARVREGNILLDRFAVCQTSSLSVPLLNWLILTACFFYQLFCSLSIVSRYPSFVLSDDKKNAVVSMQTSDIEASEKGKCEGKLMGIRHVRICSVSSIFRTY